MAESLHPVTIAVGALVAGGVLWMLLAPQGDSAGVGLETHAEVAEVVQSSAEAPVEVHAHPEAPPHAPHDHGDEGHEEFEHDPLAQVALDGRPTEAPPSMDELPGQQIPMDDSHMQPVTPEWEADQTRVLVGRMEDRIGRLEARIAAAEAAGDETEAHRQRIVLERTRQRITELNDELAALAESLEEPADGDHEQGADQVAP